MPRTIISLAPEERDWLVNRAQTEHIAQTEVVRRALRLYRQQACLQGSLSFEELAWRTSGILRGEDGLALQDRLRDEWNAK